MAALFRRRKRSAGPSYRWRATKRGFEIELCLAGQDGRQPVILPLAAAKAAGQEIPSGVTTDRCILLDELILDDIVSAGDGAYLLPYADVYHLSRDARALLTLPQDDEFGCSVQTHGIVSSDEFRVSAEITHRTHGRLEGFVPRYDSTYVLDDTTVLVLPKPLFKLVEELSAGSPKNVSNQIQARMIHQERARRLAIAAGVALEEFMASEEYLLPEDNTVSIGIERVADTQLRLTPELARSSKGDRHAARAIDDALARGATAGSAVTGVGADGRRVRALLDDDARQQIGEINDRGTIEGADVPRFLDNPEAYLPDGIDLADFGERVTGIGISRVAVRPSVTIKRDGGLLNFETELHASPIGLDGGDSVQPAEPITAADLDGLIEQAREAGEDYVYFKNRWVHVDVASLEEFKRAIAKAEAQYQSNSVETKDVQAFLEIFTNIDDLEYGDSLPLISEILEHQQEDIGPRYPIPGSLKATLYDYQKRGYAWLRFLNEQRWGGLLADDMGLGKTVQAISLLAALKAEGMCSPSLIVAPTSLLENWRKELRLFCPSLRPYDHHGATRIRDAESLRTAVAHTDIVLTTYETMRRDQLTLGRIDWKAIILDEAQYIKNPSTGVATASKSFKAERIRLAMTGTPVENGLSELWAIFDFIQPGHLGSYREFRDAYEKRIQGDDPASAELGAEELRRRIKDVYLRRLKEEELDGLPGLTTRKVEVPFGPEQLSLYQELIARARDGAPNQLLGILQRLVQTCSHPSLVKMGGEPATPDELCRMCPKLAATVEILEQIHEQNERVLIFTEYKEMQRMLMEVIHDRFGIWAGRINGEVVSRDRQTVVDQLNASDKFGALVMSPTAGGVGLNIQGANHVIHYTRLWNPAKESQATARSYRLKQTRPVTVYYPIVTHGGFDTIEVRLAALLDRKAALAKDIIRPSAGLNINAKELADLVGEAGA